MKDPANRTTAMRFSSHWTRNLPPISSTILSEPWSPTPLPTENSALASLPSWASCIELQPPSSCCWSPQYCTNTTSVKSYEKPSLKSLMTIEIDRFKRVEVAPEPRIVDFIVSESIAIQDNPRPVIAPQPIRSHHVVLLKPRLLSHIVHHQYGACPHEWALIVEFAIVEAVGAVLANIVPSSQVDAAIFPLLLGPSLKGWIFKFAGWWKRAIGSPFAQP